MHLFEFLASRSGNANITSEEGTAKLKSKRGVKFRGMLNTSKRQSAK